ncbi:MAG: hypothetical protein ACYTG3_12155 [Planctomycetota bacterium]|jgi:hypothetical protein
MSLARPRLLALAIAGSAIILCSRGSADETNRVRFAAPVRIRAGDAFLGEERLYPSPVLHDVDGDGLADIVVGDLFGRVTVARRLAAKPPVAFGAEKPINDRDGKPLRFHNW